MPLINRNGNEVDLGSKLVAPHGRCFGLVMTVTSCGRDNVNAQCNRCGTFLTLNPAIYREPTLEEEVRDSRPTLNPQIRRQS